MWNCEQEIVRMNDLLIFKLQHLDKYQVQRGGNEYYKYISFSILIILHQNGSTLSICVHSKHAFCLLFKAGPIYQRDHVWAQMNHTEMMYNCAENLRVKTTVNWTYREESGPKCIHKAYSSILIGLHQLETLNVNYIAPVMYIKIQIMLVSILRDNDSFMWAPVFMIDLCWTSYLHVACLNSPISLVWIKWGLKFPFKSKQSLRMP